MTHKLLMLVLLLTAAAVVSAGDKEVAYFGLELGKDVPAELKDRVSGNILRKTDASGDKWDSFAAVVKETGNRTGVYVVDCIYGYKTYGSKEAAEEARDARRAELVRRYEAEPGVRFSVDDVTDGVWSLTLRGLKLKLMVKRKRKR